jgi:hypothetical protein
MANIFILAAFALAAGAAATFMLATMLPDDVIGSSERHGRYASLSDCQDPSLLPGGEWREGRRQKQKLCSRAKLRIDRSPRASSLAASELLPKRWYRRVTLRDQHARTASVRV